MPHWLVCLWAWVGLNAPVLQTLCFVFSALAAFWIIWFNGKISRRESTVEMVQTTFGDEGAHYDQFSDLMRSLDAAGQSVTDYAVLTSDNRAARDVLMRQLNRYELISLGIRQHVFDEDFYKLWFFSQIMKDYDRFRPLIEGIRRDQNNHAYFCEFESLVAKWRRKRHPVKYPPIWKIMWWILTNQRAKARNALRVCIGYNGIHALYASAKVSYMSAFATNGVANGDKQRMGNQGEGFAEGRAQAPWRHLRAAGR